MSHLPPGPDFGRLSQAVRFQRDPLSFLRAAQERYGDVFTIRLAIAGHMVVFTRPEAVAQVLAADPEWGHSGEARRRIVGVISERSILGADAERHRKARAHLAPAFAPDRVDSMRHAMADIAGEHVARWPRGRPFRLLPRMRAIADEVFVRLVLGVGDPGRAAELAAALRRMLWTPGNPPLPLPRESAGLAGRLAKPFFERRSAPVARLLAAELEHRRRGGSGDEDVIGRMVQAGVSPQDAADQLIPVLMAAQEPPSAALTWLLDRLAREPAGAARFLSAPDDDPYRAAFVRETMRLRPPVHSVARRLTRPVSLGGHDLPAGVVAMVPVVLVHRDPTAFPDPDSFRPERFLDAPAGLPHLPFGGGARRCLGEPLAHAEIGAVLPAILRRVRLRPVSPRPERGVVRGTVLVPHRSGLAIAAAA